LNQPIKAEVEMESSDVLKTVEEDRKYVIQATIVRYELLHLHITKRCMKYAFLTQHHESEENDENSTSDSGSHVTDFVTVRTQDL
jgi:hypothetical protein